MHEDFDTLLPAHLAAQRVGVSRQLINYWRTRGWLTVAEVHDGAPHYRLGAILYAESTARAARLGPRARIATEAA